MPKEVGWPDWTTLPTIGDREKIDLDQEWQRARFSSNEPLGDTGRFFTRHGALIYRALHNGDHDWYLRIQGFVDQTAEWREILRGKDLSRARMGELDCMIAALGAWLALAAPSDVESVAGRYNKSYFLEAQAIRSPAMSKRIRLYERAARVADPDRIPALDGTLQQVAWLRRRFHVLKANAHRLTAFFQVRRRPQDWFELAALFESAVTHSRLAQDSAFVETDRSVELHTLWQDLMLMRGAQASGDIKLAREKHISARAAAILLPDAFEQGGRWRSTAELAAERHLLDALEVLSACGSGASSAATEHLHRWLKETGEAKVKPSPRRTELMAARHAVLSMIAAAESGKEIAIVLQGMHRRISMDQYLKRNIGPIISVLGSRPSQAKIQTALRLTYENLCEVDGDSHPRPRTAGVQKHLPSWLTTDGDSPNSAAYVSLLRYVRVVMEYLWCVYRDSASEQEVEVPQISAEDFRFLDLKEASKAAAGLCAALGWEGSTRSARALDNLMFRLRQLPNCESLDDSVEDGYFGDLLNVVVNETILDLLPLTVKAADENKKEVTEIEVTRYAGPPKGTVKGVVKPPPSWPVFALKPRYKERDDLRQLAAHRHLKPIHLYSSFTWPQPTDVRVLTEGDSDVAALTGYLDVKIPWWRGYSIRLIACGGDSLVSRYLQERAEIHDRTKKVMVIADSDKLDNQKWEEIWKHRTGFVIKPDLEQCSLPALAAAINVEFGTSVDNRDLIAAQRRFEQDRDSQIPGRCKTFVEQVEHDLGKHHVSGIKKPEFAYRLGRELASCDIQDLEVAVDYLLFCADGFAVPDSMLPPNQNLLRLKERARQRALLKQAKSIDGARPPRVTGRGDPAVS